MHRASRERFKSQGCQWRQSERSHRRTRQVRRELNQRDAMARPARAAGAMRQIFPCRMARCGEDRFRVSYDELCGGFEQPSVGSRCNNAPCAARHT